MTLLMDKTTKRAYDLLYTKLDALSQADDQASEAAQLQRLSQAQELLQQLDRNQPAYGQVKDGFLSDLYHYYQAHGQWPVELVKGVDGAEDPATVTKWYHLRHQQAFNPQAQALVRQYLNAVAPQLQQLMGQTGPQVQDALLQIKYGLRAQLLVMIQEGYGLDQRYYDDEVAPRWLPIELARQVTAEDFVALVTVLSRYVHFKNHQAVGYQPDAAHQESVEHAQARQAKEAKQQAQAQVKAEREAGRLQVGKLNDHLVVMAPEARVKPAPTSAPVVAEPQPVVDQTVAEAPREVDEPVAEHVMAGKQTAPEVNESQSEVDEPAPDVNELQPAGEPTTPEPWPVVDDSQTEVNESLTSDFDGDVFDEDEDADLPDGNLQPMTSVNDDQPAAVTSAVDQAQTVASEETAMVDDDDDNSDELVEPLIVGSEEPTASPVADETTPVASEAVVKPEPPVTPQPTTIGQPVVRQSVASALQTEPVVKTPMGAEDPMTTIDSTATTQVDRPTTIGGGTTTTVVQASSEPIKLANSQVSFEELAKVLGPELVAKVAREAQGLHN